MEELQEELHKLQPERSTEGHDYSMYSTEYGSSHTGYTDKTLLSGSQTFRPEGHSRCQDMFTSAPTPLSSSTIVRPALVA
uniref:Uncharacterized protein n=1 Tax=Timema genevievae TaxID=629358 RepID=A0A7R9K1J3_TIMGE|nr:unnamed protein product [Timema genevievae]